MEKCEHAQLQSVKQLGGPTLIMCTKCNQILKVLKK